MLLVGKQKVQLIVLDCLARETDRQTDTATERGRETDRQRASERASERERERERERDAHTEIEGECPSVKHLCTPRTQVHKYTRVHSLLS